MDWGLRVEVANVEYFDRKHIDENLGNFDGQLTYLFV